MAARNIRPRVLTAVYELGTFTVSELCRAAGLADRNQAYSQLDRLEERGFLEKKTVPAGARHAPFKQYTLVSDPVKRSEFAQEMTAYRPSPPIQEESELGRLALDEAQQELDRAEKSLAAIEGTRGKEAQTQVAEAGAELASAWTNIETAQLEYDGAANPEKRQVIAGLTERWQRAEEKRKESADKLERQTAVNWALLLRTAARAVNDLASAANPAWGSGEQVAFLSKRLFPARKKEAYRVPIEVLLDEIRADQKYPFVPVFRHALRTGDADVLFEIVRILNKIDLAWWNYNR
ncbi:MAG TPA: helix-turn-helix domain-containing protein, partial [Bryobacteraceae bacterium]